MPILIKKKIKKEFDNLKFDPPLKSRYLPGEVSKQSENTDFQWYKKHRIKCQTMKPTIDNKPPKFDIKEIYYNRPTADYRGRILIQQYKENMEVVKKLNRIDLLGGKVDCWNKIKPDYLKNRKILTNDIDIKGNEKILKINRELNKRLNDIKGLYHPKTYDKWWNHWKNVIQDKSKYPILNNNNISKCPSISNDIKLSSNNQRTKCFFDIEIVEPKIYLGRIIFELYNDYVPSICANFEAFCKGFYGKSYKGTPFHQIIAGYLCQGGDVSEFNGLGGASIYDKPLKEENYSLKHSCIGILSTYRTDKQFCDSKFNLSFTSLVTLDGKNIVFGKVIKGHDNLLKINGFGTKSGKPLLKIIISNCGLINNNKNKNNLNVKKI